MNVKLPVKMRSYAKPDGTIAHRPIREESYMTLAISMAKQATCDRLQVGAVFVDVSMERVLCAGYNGNVAGGLNGCDTHESGKCGCLHAELSALVKSRDDLTNCVCFVTTSPCVNCAKILINRRVSKVIYLQDYRLDDGLKLLKKHHVQVIKYDDLQGVDPLDE